MTAGTGIRHSEFNSSAIEPVHLYQIWMLPERERARAGYEQRGFDPGEYQGQFRVVVSPDGRDGSLTIRQDATLYLAGLEPGAVASHAIAPGRHAWLQVLRGQVALGNDGATLGLGAGTARRSSAKPGSMSGPTPIRSPRPRCCCLI